MAEGRRHEGASIPGLEIMIYAAIVIVLLVVLWHFAHDPIAWPVLWAAQRSEPLLEVYARLAALTNAAWFVDLVVPRRIYDWTDIAATSQALQALQVQDVDYPTFKKLLAIIGVVMRPALLIAAIGAVYFIYNNTAASRLRRRMTLKTMVPIAARTFPAIKPAFQQDLLAVHPDEGPWARERSPIRTAILNHLIIAHARDAWGTVQWDRPFVPTFDESLDGKAVPGLADVLYRKVDDDLEHLAAAVGDRLWQRRRHCRRHRPVHLHAGGAVEVEAAAHHRRRRHVREREKRDHRRLKLACCGSVQPLGRLN